VKRRLSMPKNRSEESARAEACRQTKATEEQQLEEALAQERVREGAVWRGSRRGAKSPRGRATAWGERRSWYAPRKRCGG